MDEELARRYEQLFLTYGAGAAGPVVDLKRRIEAFYHSGEIRADAALFLIANSDLMLFRPYFGYVPDTEGRPLPPPEAVRNNTIQIEHLYKALMQLVEALPGERPHSAHDVAQALELRWTDLSVSFGWG
jgi:hypothetical protein